MKIYTKTGDGGSTSLAGGERVGKDDLRVEAYGTVDELTAHTAYLRDGMDRENPLFDGYRSDLRAVLDTLMKVQASLAYAGNSAKSPMIESRHITFLEERIDSYEKSLTPITRFTIPGGHPLVSQAHICRTVCRRAERAAVKAAREFETDENTLKYINRLSDFLYQTGRKLARDLGAPEEYWNPV